MALGFRTVGLAAAVALALGATGAPAAGDAAAGKSFFNGICAMCHNAAKGASNKIGPNLWGIVGSKPGSVPGFNFSPAMKQAKFAWTEQNLAEYVNNPQQKVPGNRMPYGGTHNMQKAQNVAAYLATLK